MNFKYGQWVWFKVLHTRWRDVDALYFRFPDSGFKRENEDDAVMTSCVRGSLKMRNFSRPIRRREKWAWRLRKYPRPDWSGPSPPSFALVSIEFYTICTDNTITFYIISWHLLSLSCPPADNSSICEFENRIVVFRQMVLPKHSNFHPVLLLFSKQVRNLEARSDGVRTAHFHGKRRRRLSHDFETLEVCLEIGVVAIVR